MIIKLRSGISPDYHVIRFPAGEIQVRLSEETVATIGFLTKKGSIKFQIDARIKTPEDLIVLAQLKSAISGLVPGAEVHLWMGYFPGARADRRFVTGDTHGLGTTALLINAMGFKTVGTMDVHSEKTLELVNNSYNVDPTNYVIKALVAYALKKKLDKLNVLWPDKSARARYQVPDREGCNVRMVEFNHLQCAKARVAETGELLGFEVPEFEGPAMMVDDICDGGGTFIGIAKAIAASRKIPPELALYTTHGIYSKGIDSLVLWFEQMYCLDTYQEVDHPCMYQFRSLG